MEYMTLYGASFLRIISLVSSRFGEALRITQENLDSKNFYAFNPAFDKPTNCGMNCGNTSQSGCKSGCGN